MGKKFSIFYYEIIAREAGSLIILVSSSLVYTDTKSTKK